jgi:putative peptide modification system cyclase
MNLRVSLPPRPAAGSPVTPVLRAVLLADLADSTGFVQRFGDARAATALQRLDLQIRDLLEFTGGRLIDKADGLLAIFERPIQAVDFALRYQQALRQFSVDEGAPLAARVGIHVGELMTWSNTDEAVRAGAKPLEVEGLAKPVAARLMALALPGQILVSSMAQALAQRAQAELGERAERVKWVSHGRYRFKGVPAPILVHEVGELGASPLKQPPSGHKVWRELPLWRRPPVLAAELLVMLGVVGFFGWTAFRSPPALAFQQRDWVVVGDLSNFTGDLRLDDSLDTALRVDLGQSRYVNVVSDLKVREALQRMGRSDKATVDRAVGSEIALREGARALLLPSVAEVGGKLRVSVEVVDPNTQTTVFAQSADGRGIGTALASLDSVTGDLRAALGESLASIDRSDKPLAKATTQNIDALRAYSLAVAALHQSRDRDALMLLQRALALDPEFAMAQAALARVHARSGNLPEARRLAMAAASHRDRLSQREAMELDAIIARFGPPSGAMARNKLWAATYPDSFGAYYGYARSALDQLEYQDGVAFLAPALSTRNFAQGNAYFLQGVLQLALNRYPQASASFHRSESLGVGGDKLEFAELHAAQRDFAGARRALRAQKSTGMAGHDAHLGLDDPLFLLDQGKWRESVAAYESLATQLEPVLPLQAESFRGTLLSLSNYEGRLQPGQWREWVERHGKRVASGAIDEREQALFPLLAGGWLAARNGDAETANKALALAGPALAGRDDSILVGMRTIVQAELALLAKEPAKAIAMLLPRHDGSELYFSHAVLMRAYLEAQDLPAALTEAAWLARERGRAYAEPSPWDMWSAANVIESNLALLAAAEANHRLGREPEARRHLKEFLHAWPKPPGFVEARVQRLQVGAKPRP